MSHGAVTIAGSRLRRLARAQDSPGAGQASAPVERTQRPDAAGDERCELCGAPISKEHRHMLELSSRQLLCICRPCAVLFEREGAGGAQYKLLPGRRLRLRGFELDDQAWERLQIPVEMAFFFGSSAKRRVIACYPGPMGPVESLLQLRSWRQIRQANPVLSEMEQDVEALLVNRVRGAREHWLVPLDDCYSLVGLIRTRWRGLAGGSEVWQELTRFFEALDASAKDVSARDLRDEDVTNQATRGR